MAAPVNEQPISTGNYRLMLIALIVALGGLLMGFDASVISGVVGFIETKFELTKIQLGWSVSSLTLTSTLAMMVSGPLSNRIGRKKVLTYAAILYAISAIGSALAPDFVSLVIFRMIGGFGVGASLIIAPMYIAEISPPEMRGRMVSFNQLNIVIGISLAFFTNYLILRYSQSDAAWVKKAHIDTEPWRWMLGLETLPAVLYFFGLFLVPKSPRWLILKGRFEEAKKIMTRFSNAETADREMAEIRQSIEEESKKEHSKQAGVADLFKPALRLVITIGIVVAVLQQITGINSVFFYAPMIFEQSGIGTDASFVQAILVGITNLVFTVLAILFIDRFGRKPLLIVGVAGIVVSMFLLSYGFRAAEYSLSEAAFAKTGITADQASISALYDHSYPDEQAFREAAEQQLGTAFYSEHGSTLSNAALHINPVLILIGILGFVASFAISIGPVMWVLFSELFPNRIRGLAISFVGLINSAVSFIV